MGSMDDAGEGAYTILKVTILACRGMYRSWKASRTGKVDPRGTFISTPPFLHQPPPPPPFPYLPCFIPVKCLRHVSSKGSQCVSLKARMHTLQNEDAMMTQLSLQACDELMLVLSSRRSSQTGFQSGNGTHGNSFNKTYVEMMIQS